MNWKQVLIKRYGANDSGLGRFQYIKLCTCLETDRCDHVVTVEKRNTNEFTYYGMGNVSMYVYKVRGYGTLKQLIEIFDKVKNNPKVYD